MGIPFYFKHLINRHTNIVTSASKTFATNGSCSRLFLDFNCAIHQCANLVNQKYGNKSLEDLFPFIYEECYRYLERLVNVVKPSTLVYIAIDGVCPYAKMVQQRSRRYISQWKNDEINKVMDRYNIAKSSWNSCVATPGTEFMKGLNDYFNNRKITMENLFSCDVIISDSDVFGEGEHKIFAYINKYSDTQTHNDVVYGLDADLILLSMLSVNSDKISLLREKPFFDTQNNLQNNDEFLTLNIAYLKHSLYNGFISETNNRFLEEQAFVKDYVFLMTFLGNDFLPPLSFLKIADGGINIILDAYKVICDEFQEPFITRGGINIAFLIRLLSIIGRNEDTQMNEAITTYMNRKPRNISRQLNVVDIKTHELDNYPVLHRHRSNINPSLPGWRLEYFYELFGTQDQTVIAKVCTEYIKGLFWVYQYYFCGTASMEWHYPFSYTPTIIDIHNFVVSHENISDDLSAKLHKNADKIEFSPAFQLLLVLPPSCVNLLPNKLRPIMNLIENGCQHYYPHQFTMCTFLKYYLWECHPSLPPFDLAHISNVYKRLFNQT